MKKHSFFRIYSSLICALVLSVSSALFVVYADNDGSFFYIPNESITAYDFFLSYGLTYDNSYGLTDSNVVVPSYQISVPSHKITPNYTRFFTSTSTYTISQSGTSSNPSWRVPVHANYTYFAEVDSTGTVVYVTNPYETVSAYKETVNSYSTSEANSLTDKLNYHSLTGTFVNPSAYSVNNRLYISSGRSQIISFFSNKSLPNPNGISLFVNNGSSSDFTVNRSSFSLVGGQNQLYKYTYTITNNSSSGLYVTPIFNFSSLNNMIIVPLFVGRSEDVTDQYCQFLGIDSEVEKLLKSIDLTTKSIDDNISLLVNGDSSTQIATDKNDSSTSSFVSISNSLHDFESSSINSLNNNLESIGSSNDIVNSTGFLDAAWLVRNGFDYLIRYDSSGALGLLLTFCLILGISLTVIGKLRNN